MYRPNYRPAAAMRSTFHCFILLTVASMMCPSRANSVNKDIIMYSPLELKTTRSHLIPSQQHLYHGLARPVDYSILHGNGLRLLRTCLRWHVTNIRMEYRTTGRTLPA